MGEGEWEIGVGERGEGMAGRWMRGKRRGRGGWRRGEGMGKGWGGGREGVGEESGEEGL